MFTLSSKAIYGITAVIELAHHYPSGPLQVRDIVRRHDIPQHYLEQILNTLKRTGIVRSYRGTRGGYELARHPDTISVLDVLTTLDGPLAVRNTSRTSDTLSFLWDELEDRIADFLSCSLGDVTRKQNHPLADKDFVI